MAQKTLLIGLGGTGNLALKFAKKRYYQMDQDASKSKNFNTYDIDDIKFLAIDTDLKDLKKPTIETTIEGSKEYALNGNDWYYIDCPDAKDVVKDDKYISKNWMPKTTVRLLDDISDGAGQIRAFGRFGLMYHFDQVKQQVKNRINELNAWDKGGADGANSSNSINIVLCFSISGGTGSGTFIDMAYLIREAMSEFNNVKFDLMAYLIMPEIFDQCIKFDSQKINIWSNAYAALRELEFFMDPDLRQQFEEEYRDEYGKSKMVLTDGADGSGQALAVNVDGKPFDFVNIISNESIDHTGQTYYYDNKSDLMELLGNTLAFKSSEHYISTNSSWDNVKKVLASAVTTRKGTKKIPRYISVGYAEMVSKLTPSLKDLASYQMMANFISALISSNNENLVSKSSLEQKIKDWGINERKECDDVLEALIPSSVTQDSYMSNKKAKGWDFQTENNMVKMHIDDMTTKFTKSILKESDKLFESTVKEIRNFFLDPHSGVIVQGGIETALTGVQRLRGVGIANDSPYSISGFLHEMSFELNHPSAKGSIAFKDVKHNDRKDVEAQLEQACKMSGSWFNSNRDNKINASLTDLATVVDNEVEAIRGTKTREAAQDFFQKLDQNLSKLENELITFSKKLDTCLSHVNAELRQLFDKQSEAGVRPFEINLANDLIAMTSSKFEDKIDDFSMNYLTSHKGLKSHKHESENLRSQSASEAMTKEASLANYPSGNGSTVKGVYDLIKSSITAVGFSENGISLEMIFHDYINQTDSFVKMLDYSIKDILLEIQGQDNRLEVDKKYDQLKKKAYALTTLNVKKMKQKIGDLWSPTMTWAVPDSTSELFKPVGVGKNELMQTGDPNFMCVASMYFPARITNYSLDKYFAEYKDKTETISADVDMRISALMNRMRHHLVENADLGERALFTWCFGFVLHKETDGKQGIFRDVSYKIISRKHGDPTNNNEHVFVDSDTGKKTAWRTRAFEAFRSNTTLVNELNKSITKYIGGLSSEARSELLDSFALDKNGLNDKYDKTYANLGRSRGGTDPRQEADTNLLNDEIKFMHSMTLDQYLTWTSS